MLLLFQFDERMMNVFVATAAFAGSNGVAINADTPECQSEMRAVAPHGPQDTVQEARPAWPGLFMPTAYLPPRPTCSSIQFPMTSSAAGAIVSSIWLYSATDPVLHV